MSKREALTDEGLIQSFKDTKDNLFLEELYSRHIRFVFLICMKYLKEEEKAKDTSMQVFEKLTDDLQRFEIRNFKSWLHTVTKNTCLVYLRSNKSLSFFSLNGEKNMENIPDMHHNDVDGIELRIELLEKAINTLDDEQKKCIELFYLKEKSYKEVVELTGFSLNQVKSCIQNGKRNLKNYFLVNGNTMMIIFIALYYRL
jgi:RNA polymerase sigma factor (sigma-70 family)